MGLQEDFAYHCELAKKLNCCREDKLHLYGLEKQATYGPVMTVRPGMHNRKDPQEWEAWKAVEAKPKGEAMSEFCKKVTELAAAEAAAAAGAAGAAAGAAGHLLP